MRIAILVTIAASIIVLETDISLGISDNDFEQLLGRVKDIEDRGLIFFTFYPLHKFAF